MPVLSLETLRNAIRTSIRGRRLGLDTTTDSVVQAAGVTPRGGLLVGIMGARLPIQINTSTVPTSFFGSGYIEIGATTASTNTIIAPIPGATVMITQTATSTLGHQVKLTAGNYNSSTGSSNISMFLWGQGASAQLVGLSTAIWAVVSGMGQTTLAVSFSTAA